MSTLQEANSFVFAGNVPAARRRSAGTCSDVYEQNRQRIYALAFWITDNELAAEELMINTFCCSFAKSEAPTPEEIDCAFIAEARQCMPLAGLTLECAP